MVYDETEVLMANLNESLVQITRLERTREIIEIIEKSANKEEALEKIRALLEATKQR